MEVASKSHLEKTYCDLETAAKEACSACGLLKAVVRQLTNRSSKKIGLLLVVHLGKEGSVKAAISSYFRRMLTLVI